MMNNKYKIVLAVAPLVAFLDQLTKWFVVDRIPFGHRIPVLENFFDLVHVRNRGAAFGVLSQWDSAYRDVFFYLLSILAVVFLFHYLKETSAEEKMPAISVGLILGGAIGNVVDRFFRGSVVDFLSFHWYDRTVDWTIFGNSVHFDLVWPAFNVADSAITVGILTLLFVMPLRHQQES